MKTSSKTAWPTLIAASSIAAAALTTSVQATEAGDWLVRARAININPTDSHSTWVRGQGNPLLTIPGSEVEVDDAWTLDIDITYMFDKHWGTELLLAVPAKHDIKAQGTLSGLGTIADTKLLPPGLILQYHFMPDSQFRPYAGLGVDYAIFFDSNSKSSLDGAIGSTDVDIDNAWGWIAQVGLDYDLTENWFLNADIKYIGLSTTAKLDSPDGRRKTDVNIDPFVFGIGAGYRF